MISHKEKRNYIKQRLLFRKGELDYEWFDVVQGEFIKAMQAQEIPRDTYFPFLSSIEVLSLEELQVLIGSSIYNNLSDERIKGLMKSNVEQIRPSLNLQTQSFEETINNLIIENKSLKTDRKNLEDALNSSIKKEKTALIASAIQGFTEFIFGEERGKKVNTFIQVVSGVKFIEGYKWSYEIWLIALFCLLFTITKYSWRYLYNKYLKVDKPTNNVEKSL